MLTLNMLLSFVSMSFTPTFGKIVTVVTFMNLYGSIKLGVGKVVNIKNDEEDEELGKGDRRS